MTTRYRFIHFKGWGNDWVCLSTSKPETKLGMVEYFEPWKKWQFCPEPHRGFTIDCLRDIEHFIGQLAGTSVKSP